MLGIEKRESYEGKILKDKINNQKICEMTDVERLEEFLREQRLRWLEHVEKMDEERGPVKALLTLS